MKSVSILFAKTNYFWEVLRMYFINKIWSLAKKKTGTESLKKLVVEAILNKKGREVVSLDLRKINDAAADYFIITHGDSSTQVKAIFDSIVYEAGEKGLQPYHSEGGKNSEWIIVDFVDVVVHIFHRDKRDFYDLEDLWSDGKLTKHSDDWTKFNLQ